MSLIVLKNGEQFEVETPTGKQNGNILGVPRNVINFAFTDFTPEEKLKATQAFADPTKTEEITLYFPEQKKVDDIVKLKGAANEVYIGYTVLGEVKEINKVVTEATPDTPPVHARQLTIEIGQRQFWET